MTQPYRENASIIARRADSSRFDRVGAGGQFLIVHKPRIYNAWQFPQGGVEIGESARSAALREFTEELGTNKIRIEENECGVFQYDWPEEIQHERGYAGQNVHFFRAEFLGDDADFHLQAEELDDFRWVDLKELKNYFENQDYLNTVLQILGSENN